ncbi:MAG: excinuclease ABC subunit UvrC [Patescibacteria group bacterium]|nr:excinuclease ABC subunit UvrC [Patescibacteria group bacterium]
MKKLKNIPKGPGIYKMLNSEGQVIYVGKAKNLDKRIKSYFQKKDHGIRMEKMIANMDDIKWIETDSEIEALILETNLIKELRPKYNILMKDDKNFVYIKITTNEDFPRITTVRKVLKDGAKYFGPILASHKVDKMFKILRKVLPFRNCSLDIEIQKGKAVVIKKTIKYPCLDHYIKRCITPCTGLCTKEEYMKIIEQVIDFLEGKPEEIIKKVKKEMMDAAAEKKFEIAASLRDKLKMVEEISQKQVVSDPNMKDMDIINFHREGTYYYFNLFQIRNGKLVNQENFTSKSAEVEDDPKEILETFIKQYYKVAVSIPKEVVIPSEIEKIFDKWIGTHFLVPQRGDKIKLLKLALKNAESYAKQCRVKVMQEGIDPVEELQTALNLKKRPVRIECYDISHLSGTNQVGSMVVFENGLAKKSDYRRFKLRKVEKIDDYASLEEVLTRRLSYISKIQDEYATKKALKKELPFIKETVKRARIKDHKEFYTIKKKDKICGFIQKKVVNEKNMLSALWIDEKERGKKLGQRLIGHAIKKSEAKRLYLSCRKELASYYSEIGFQQTKTIPKGLEKEHKYCNEKYCALNTEGVWFVYDKKKGKDTSFSGKPDLIIIDGGKGQLGVGEKTLKKFKSKVPVISIAKKNEEIFYAGKKLILTRTSDALKLVQRIRDEAHRFAVEYQKKLRKF